MNKRFLLFVLLILSFSCANNTDSNTSTTTQEADATPSLSQPKMTTIGAGVYEAALDASLKDMPIDRLCQESKGYKNHLWEGMNKCSWAVEKFRIDQNKDKVQRNGDQLQLLISDSGRQIELTHLKATSEQRAATFYQFQGYLPKADTYYLEVFRGNQCPQFWMINATTGARTSFNGRPVFNDLQDAFMMSTAVPKNASCPNELSFWKLVDQTFTQQWSVQPEHACYDLIWASKNQWQAKCVNQGDQSVVFRQITSN